MCDNCQWEDLLVEIEDMLDSDRFAWAADTLEGIHAWVRKSEHCTEGQRAAVDNIARSAER